MTLRCVVDASVAVKVFLPEADSERAVILLNELTDAASQLHVPDLFYIEVANVLWKSVKRKRLTARTAHESLSDLALLRFISHPLQGLIEDALAIALTHDLSAYDAAYVALSARLGYPLMTYDSRLLQRVTPAFDVRLL